MNQQSDNSFNSWLPFYTLLRKEIRRFLRVASQTLVTPVITASLYLFIFGATLGERISVLEGFSYAQFVIPGLILMGIINNSFSNVASSLFMSRYLGSIVDLLVTPVTPTQFIMAYTLAAMLRGLVVGLVVWLISCLFATLPWAHPFAAIAMACLARVYKKCRTAGAGQGGGQFAADMPGFAHADDHNAPLATEHVAAGVCEVVIHAAG